MSHPPGNSTWPQSSCTAAGPEARGQYNGGQPLAAGDLLFSHPSDRQLQLQLFRQQKRQFQLSLQQSVSSQQDHQAARCPRPAAVAADTRSAWPRGQQLSSYSRGMKAATDSVSTRRPSGYAAASHTWRGPGIESQQYSCFRPVSLSSQESCWPQSTGILGNSGTSPYFYA